MPFRHQLEPGKTVRLSDISPNGKDYHDDRERAEREFEKLRLQLVELQRRLYAEGKQKLLVILQAMDAGGKDSTIRKVFEGVNPQGVRVTSFKVPTHKELAHDYLWRVHKAVPAVGMIGVFNRSHYGDVLVVRVDQLVPESVWRQRYEQINNFEKLLADTGTQIVKFYLHISRKEQKERFQDRLDEPSKHWKFSRGDLEKRRQWEDYMKAYEDVLTKCTTPWAPWHVIPANQKWYRNLAVGRTLVKTLQNMNPQYPKAVDDLSDVVIE